VAKFTDIDDVTLIEKSGRSPRSTPTGRTTPRRCTSATSRRTTPSKRPRRSRRAPSCWRATSKGPTRTGRCTASAARWSSASATRRPPSWKSATIKTDSATSTRSSERSAAREIEELEPKVVEGRDPTTALKALQTPDGYVVDYGAVAKSFVDAAREEDGVGVHLGTAVENVDEGYDGFTVETDDGDFEADAVVVAAGSHSLQFAKEMGYGEHMSLLPVAGSFFLADDLLNGKVYTLQMKKLPFAAVHGDADVHDGGVTRFGPTAKLVPALERGRLSTVSDFADVFGFRRRRS